MTKVKFNLNITCVESSQCTKNILDKLKIKFPNEIFEANLPSDIVTGHVSISHVPGNHVVWLFLYDTDGVHEFENTTTKLIQKISSDRVKKSNATVTNSDLNAMFPGDLI